MRNTNHEEGIKYLCYIGIKYMCNIRYQPNFVLSRIYNTCNNEIRCSLFPFFAEWLTSSLLTLCPELDAVLLFLSVSLSAAFSHISLLKSCITHIWLSNYIRPKYLSVEHVQKKYCSKQWTPKQQTGPYINCEKLKFVRARKFYFHLCEKQYISILRNSLRPRNSLTQSVTFMLQTWYELIIG